MGSLFLQPQNLTNVFKTSDSIDVLASGITEEKGATMYYKAFCNAEKPEGTMDFALLYWTPVAYLILFIVLLIVDGLIPRLCSCWCSRTPATVPSEAQPFDTALNDRKTLEDLHLDPDYEAKMVHNPEMVILGSSPATPGNMLTDLPPPASSSVAPSTESVQVSEAMAQQLKQKENGQSVKPMQ
uniref:Protein with signal anchor n=1 Tax=Panagrellus redivivus TaxID=6233 RepID=A0A7E4UYH3_PANRE